MNRDYERVWFKLKRPTYKSNNLETYLITTDEFKGISTEKIDSIVNAIFSGEILSEDKTNKYFPNHFSLR